MPENLKLNYVEIPATNISATKKFFEEAFDWTFVDYGPEYTSFADQGLHGGFFQSEKSATVTNGSALLVLLTTDLEQSLSTVTQAGGEISTPIFSFPGGRRFHFIEPSGNEFAIWALDET